MLMIYEKEIRPDCLTRVTQFFNYKKKKEWFSDPFVRKVIKDIYNCEVVKDEYIESLVWGGIAPERLSTGVKALILMLLCWIQEKKYIH